MAPGNLDTIMSVIDNRARQTIGDGLLHEVAKEQQMDSDIDETGTTADITSAAEERYLNVNFSLQELEEVQKVDVFTASTRTSTY